MIKKQKLFLLIIFIAIIPLINITTNNQTKITINSNTYLTPANNAFDDDNFYKCIIDKYNKDNNEELSYDTNLSDEQLASIKYLDCNNIDEEEAEKIKSVKGLEKLTSLTHLDLDYNQLTNIDISKNTTLTYLSLSSNQLTSIDVSKNTALTDLDLFDNQLTSIDLSHNLVLEELYLDENVKIIGLSDTVELNNDSNKEINSELKNLDNDKSNDVITSSPNTGNISLILVIILSLICLGIILYIHKKYSRN